MHMLGFFSVFNSGHMNTFTLYKSHLDASKGGRLSATLDMQTRDTLVSKPTVSGNIGIIASQATVALPLGKKVSVYLSGRKTYLGLLVKPLTTKMTDTPVDYDFEDYNATFVFQPSEKDKVTANFYYGSDYLDIETGIYQTEGRIKWSNIAASILWNRPLGRIGEMTHTFYITRYKNRLSISQNQFTAWLPSEITDYGYKNIFSFREEKFLGTYGLEYVYHHMYPQIVETQGAYTIHTDPDRR